MALSATPAAGDPVVRIESVSKRYGAGAFAVESLDLEIRRGEILTLLGPSGCGKTTTLRMVIGLEKCTAGRILHRGAVVDDPAARLHVPSHKRDMGMVFQSYAIWPHMTVGENVAYPLRLRRRPDAEVRERVLATLAMVGLAGFQERPATQLSGGQQQRVALARSLVFEPDLLLLDEPFSNLDAQLRDQMRVEVKVLQRRLGISVLFVTHDQGEALSLSDRIAVMHKGRVEQVGSPEELYRRPATRVVRDFLGRMIVLEGRVESVTDGAAEVSLDKERARRALLPRTNGLEAGQPCQLAIRPENVVAPRGADLPGNDGLALAGRVEATLFLGDCYEVRVRLPWGESLVTTVEPDRRLSEGDELRLFLPAAELRAWPL